MLTAQNITKSFGGSQALQRVSVQFAPGEVVALVGENGAGKSTLLKVLAAVVKRDEGEASIDGKVYNPQSQVEAEALGVALVFQELNVNLSLSVAENVMLGRLRRFRRFGLIDWRALKAAAQEILDQIGAEFTVDDDITTLDLGQIKTIEVARALAVKPRFIFFDESTAFLSHAEAGRLMRVVAQLRLQGIGVVFVSHHLQEVFEIADRLIVLKDGALVGSYAAAQMNVDRLYELMVGRELVGGLFPQANHKVAGSCILAMHGLKTANLVGPIDLELHRGEILGIGGLKGSGGEGVIAAFSGRDRMIAGQMERDGSSYFPRLPCDAWAVGVATLPGDRTGEGVITDSSVMENLTLAARPCHLKIVSDRSAMREIARTQVATLGIKTPDIEAPVDSLSGGNMQKVVLGKCLAVGPDILLLNNPTRGVDVGAKADIYRVIRKLADNGLAVLVVTEDLPELLGLSDRIIVTRRGQISHAFERGATPMEEEVVKWMM